ncbi:MAG: LytR/AlgR family response regulator transcription factor [Crocinitomicaceae bacterium]
MRAIIVDDEFRARGVLQNLLATFCTDVDVVAECKDVESAVEEINKHKPDLVFLDVEMPRYSGYELVDFFDEINFNIVFVTAYDQYAVKAFEISAIDYLLKPIEVERLVLAVSKVQKNIEASAYKERLNLLANDIKKSKESFAYVLKGYTHYTKFDDIVAFEAQGAYTLMHLFDSKPVLISKNIKVIEMEMDLVENLQRIHRSWVINRLHILKYAKSDQKIFLPQNIVAKLSRQFKKEAEKFFQHY